MTLRNSDKVRPNLTLDFRNSKKLDPRITFTRASFAPATDPGSGTGIAGGQNNMFNVNVPRLTDQGLLIEESRTNYNYPSNDLSDSRYTVSPDYTTSNQSAPDGSNDAVYFAETVGQNRLYVNPAVSTQTFTSSTGSVYVKVLGDRRYFAIREVNTASNWVRAVFDCTGEGSYKTVEGDVVTRTGFTPYIENVGNGWYRCSLNVTYSTAQRVGFYFNPSDTDTGGSATNTGNGGPQNTAKANSGIILWGYQQEAGNFPTSLIPTTTAEVTRAADICEITGTNFSSWYTQNEWTVTNSFNVSGSSTGQLHGASFFGGGQVLTSSAVNNSMQHFFLNGPSPNAVINYSNPVPPTNNTDTKSALNFVQQSTAQGATNGVLATDISNTPSTKQTINQLSFGQRYKGTTNTTGYIQRFSFYPTSVPDSALQGATQRGGIRKL